MAKKKKARPRKKKSSASKSLKPQFLRIFTGISILIILVVTAALIADYLIEKKPSIPSFEVYPKEDVPSRKPKAVPVVPGRLPKVVIIVDDLGYDKKMAQRFIDLDADFTFSVLPLSPFQKSIASYAYKKGHEVMLHLPMEPFEYPGINPGKGALLSSMGADELIDQLERDIDDVPFIRGVNNHMGSKITSTSDQMRQIFTILKIKKLYFVDSRTTSKTLCKPSAQLLQIPFAERDIFLDNVQKPDAIREQLQKLINVAKKHGDAIGIAHPHKTTYAVFQKMLPELKKQVELVPASKVVRISG